MKNKYTLEIGFLVMVIAVSLVGFSSLALGEQPMLDAYHVLHIITSLAWLLLLLTQIMFIRQHRFRRHRTIGTSIFVAGPVLVASLTLMTVHSAAKDAVMGTADDFVVQNVTFAAEVALLVLLAFIMRRNRNVHGALLMSTALMFLVIALFFALVSYVPGYRSEGPSTVPRFAAAAQSGALICSVIGLLFFFKNWRTGWPWLLTTSFFVLNGYLQATVDPKPLTMLVASIGRVPAVALSLTIFLALLGVAWKVVPATPTKRGLITEPTSP
ncbi:hypothetical protein [Gemmatimonas sp.]|uniref:hypothetical protein n=1 Tax=Gemmatimonas sp. TaxID=1962908 RepID=UPI0039837C89